MTRGKISCPLQGTLHQLALASGGSDPLPRGFQPGTGPAYLQGMMQMRMVQVLQQEIQIKGVAAQTIFPLVEAWLQESSKRWHALEEVASRKNMDRYQSVVDFVFAELFPRWRSACFRFYEDRGPLLRYQMSEPERQVYEAQMLLFLTVAYESVRQGQRWCWRQTVRAAERLAA